MPETQMPEAQTPQQSELNASPQRDPKKLDRQQPDLMLDLSNRRMGDGGMSLVAVAIVVMLAIIFFGLNGRSTESSTPSEPIPLMTK